MIECARDCGVDRVELYTGKYAKNYLDNKETSVFEYIKASEYAISKGLQVNAGHDLDLNNLKFLKDSLSNLFEVSIGHALVCDTFEYGLKNTIQKYLTITNQKTYY